MGIIAAVAVLAGGSAVAIVTIADENGPRQGGALPDLSLPQSATAEDAGFSFTISKAEFSGTATFVEMAANATDDAKAGDTLTIPPSAFGPGSLKPENQNAGIELVVGADPIAVRMRPATPIGPFKVAFRAVDARLAGSAAVRRTGEWSLDLKPPADVAAALRTEELRGVDEATAQGITVHAVSATRSTTETLVTVQLDGPPGIATQALPRIDGTNPPVFGARVGGSDGPGLATFAFPNTPMGEPFHIGFDGFIVTNTDDGGEWTDIALGDLLARQAVRGKPRDTAVVDRTDILQKSPGLASDVLEVWFAGTNDGSRKTVAFVFTGLYQDALQFALTLADGRVLPASLIGSQTGTTATGEIGGGEQSFVSFQFESMDDLKGSVRLSFGATSEVVRGPWVVTFAP